MMIGRLTRGLVGLIAWLVILAGLALTIVPRFLDRIYHEGPVSGHYDGARFFNPDGEDTVRVPGGGNRARFLWNMLTGSDGRPVWPDVVPVTPAARGPALSAGAMRVTWIGHATVLVETPGFAMLTDPIWAERAGPLGFGPQRVARPGMRIADLPRIDLIVVSHNHYDHMDLATLKTLWLRDRPLIVTSLGNDALMQSAGIGDAAHLVALDWQGGISRSASCPAGGPSCPQFAVRVTRNHHWSTRWGTDRNRALWSSFTVDTPSGRVFFAGDTGFGDGRWAGDAIADGVPVRLAILPVGAFRFQPGEMGTGSHVGPREAVKLWQRLGRPPTLPIHWGTFRLSSEGYDTPPRMLAAIMRCASDMPGAFAARPIGAAWMVPEQNSGAPADDAAIDRCAASPEVRALK